MNIINKSLMSKLTNFSDQFVQFTQNPKSCITEFDIELGRRVRDIRRIKRTTQKELSEKIGVSLQQLAKYESGKNRLSVSRLSMIAEVLDVPLSSLLDIEQRDGFKCDFYMLKIISVLGKITNEEHRSIISSNVESLASQLNRKIAA